jgi:hypothetical protein
MFLQRTRARPRLTTSSATKQSGLAAVRWRAITDAERQPYLAQAEQEKMEYEAARRSTGFGASVNFGILPDSPHFPPVKMDSESESEGFMADEGEGTPSRRRSSHRHWIQLGRNIYYLS